MPIIWHTDLSRKFSLQFENKDTIFQIEAALMMLLELKNYVGIYGDGILAVYE